VKSGLERCHQHSSTTTNIGALETRETGVLQAGHQRGETEAVTEQSRRGWRWWCHRKATGARAFPPEFDDLFHWMLNSVLPGMWVDS